MFEVDFHILNQKATPAIYADTLANIPAAGFAGRLFVNTATPYGVYRDTGTAWIQIASNGGGGGGSTGVNGLSGTTNIALGGSLIEDDTEINGGGNKNILFNILDHFQVITNTLELLSGNINGSDYGRIYGNGSSLEVGQNINRFVIYNFAIETYVGNAKYGLSLNDNTGKFALGDYNNDRKYNCFVVNDDTGEFYINTSYNQVNNSEKDLFLAVNASTGTRFVKIGDFNQYTNGVSFIVNDATNVIYTDSVNTGNAGILFNFSSENYRFGANNALIECDNSGQSILLSTNNLLLSGPSLEDPIPGVVATKALLITLNGTQYKINLY